MTTVSRTVRYEWHEAGPVGLDAMRHLVLPPTPAVPGIYRITLSDRPGKDCPGVYIGEGGSLRKRLNNYRRPSTMYTAGHNHEVWVDHLEHGGSVHLEIITSAEIIDGDQAHPLVLGRKSARELMENVALTVEYMGGDVHVLNRDPGAERQGGGS